MNIFYDISSNRSATKHKILSESFVKIKIKDLNIHIDLNINP